MLRMQAGAGTAQSAVTYANLWRDGRWLQNATVSIDASGNIADVSTPARTSAPVVSGLTLPGLVDAHCHAFQRALGAWTQRAAQTRDDFWSWRETMYALAGGLQRDDLEAITARCYLELLRGGYTSVAEFLYLHRLGDRRNLDADASVAAAARRTGMRLTLLPTLYQHSDFGGAPPKPGQQPFVRETARFLEDWQELCRRYPDGGPVALGVAFHSLRAVDIDTISARAACAAGPPAVPLRAYPCGGATGGSHRLPAPARTAAGGTARIARAAVFEMGAGACHAVQRSRVRTDSRRAGHRGVVPDDRGRPG